MLRIFRSLRRWRSAETVDTATSLWERFLPKPGEIVTWLGVFFASGAGMTYLAYLTAWLRDWGPVAWGAIGICSGGAVLLLFALAGRLRARRHAPALEARVAPAEAHLQRIAGEMQPALKGLSELQRDGAAEFGRSVAALRSTI